MSITYELEIFWILQTTWSYLVDEVTLSSITELPLVNLFSSISSGFFPLGEAKILALFSKNFLAEAFATNYGCDVHNGVRPSAFISLTRDFSIK